MMEQQEQQASPVKISPYASPMYNFGSSIITLTNPEDEVYNLELTMRGLKEVGGELQSVGAPIMNDQGVARFIGVVQSIVNKIEVMSDMGKDDIPMLMQYLAETLAVDLMYNRGKYKIENGADRNIIFFSALSLTYVCLRRAYEGGDRRFWKGSVQELHTKTVSDKPRGILSKLWGGAKK